MKNKVVNKIFKIIAICLSIVICLLLIDFLVLKFTGFGPIIAVKDKSDNNAYNAVFYKVWKCDKEIIIKSLKSEYSCEETKLDKDDFIVQDETKECDDALQEIARDDLFIYYLPCIKSHTMFLKYGDGTKISVKYALKEKKVTISELKNKGVQIFQEVIYKE